MCSNPCGETGRNTSRLPHVVGKWGEGRGLAKRGHFLSCPLKAKLDPAEP